MTTSNEVVSTTHGTLYMRKKRGKKLTFLIGGPTLEWCQEHVVGSIEHNVVYVHIEFDTNNRVEWSRAYDDKGRKFSDLRNS